jgi:peptidoglycan/xylan/chitin deacetylase (PgdA/CDA1 family)
MQSNCLILSLHRVGYPPPNAKIRGLFTSPELLTFQLKLLKRLGYRFATLKNAMAADVSEKVAVITFDDGYEDNFTAGLPILEKFNVPATVFVITGDVGAQNKSWEEAGEDLPASFMDWKTLRTLSARGWEIGSHAHNHIHLARYSRGHQEQEIVRSICEIEDNIGKTPVSFAYPYGSFDQKTKEVLAKTEIKLAVTTIPPSSKITPVPQDLLELGRVSIGGRLFHHYCKSVFRTLKAVDIRGLMPLPGRSRPAPAFLNRTIAAGTALSEPASALD